MNKDPTEQIEVGAPLAKPERRKRCAKCGKLQVISAFPKHTTSSDGLASYCRDCKNELASERRFKDPVARLRHYIVTRIKNETDPARVPEDLHTALETYLGYKLFRLSSALRKEVMHREGITLVESFRRGYHLDHKQPHSSFLSKQIGDAAFQACWAIDNLWMIPAKTNLQKGAKQGLVQQITEDTTVEDDDEDYTEDEGDGLDE